MKRKLDSIIKYLKSLESKPSETLSHDIHEKDRIEKLDQLLTKSSKLSTAHKITPRKEFVDASKNRIFDQLMESQKIHTARREPKRYRRGYSKPLLASPVFSIILILILGFGFVGSVQAAESAAPGDTMYVVDITLENVRLNLAVNDFSRVHLRLEFANERLLEARNKLNAGDISNANLALLGFENNLFAVREIIFNAKDEIKAGLVQILANHNFSQIALLEEMLESATAEIQELILNVISVADHTYMEIAQLPQATVVDLIIITHHKFFTEDLQNLKPFEGLTQTDESSSPEESNSSNSQGDEYLPPGIIDNPNKEDDLPPGLIDKEKPPGLEDKDNKKK